MNETEAKKFIEERVKQSFNTVVLKWKIAGSCPVLADAIRIGGHVVH